MELQEEKTIAEILQELLESRQYTKLRQTIAEMNTTDIAAAMGEMEDDFTWEAEFGLFGTDWREKKYLSRFDLRMYLEEGGSARLEIQYDSSGVWEKMPEIRGRSRRSFVIPVIPRRCDHLRFRLIGTGEMRLYSLSRILEVSTDG